MNMKIVLGIVLAVAAIFFFFTQSYAIFSGLIFLIFIDVILLVLDYKLKHKNTNFLTAQNASENDLDAEGQPYTCPINQEASKNRISDMFTEHRYSFMSKSACKRCGKGSIVKD